MFQGFMILVKKEGVARGQKGSEGVRDARLRRSSAPERRFARCCGGVVRAHHGGQLPRRVEGLRQPAARFARARALRSGCGARQQMFEHLHKKG
jgi:hypothetical protein